MQQTQDKTQTTLLQRCKQTIETLHQELVHIQINNELLIAQRDSLRKIIQEKDKMIFQLDDRLATLHNKQSLQNSHAQYSQSDLQLTSKQYSEMRGRDQVLKKGATIYNFTCQKQDKSPNNKMAEMDSGLLCSRSLEIDQSYQISVNDMLASDKKILVYIIKQKDKQINNLGNQNLRLKKQKDRLTKQYKKIVDKLDSSQLKVIRLSRENSAASVLKTPKKALKIPLNFDEYEYKDSLSKHNDNRESPIIWTCKSKPRSKFQTPGTKTSRKNLNIQNLGRQRQKSQSPQQIYYSRKH